MRALVTGGAGFIGSNLVDSLLEAGHSVVVLDNLTTGKRENLNPQAKFVEMSIDDPGVEAVLRENSIEIVFHHAAQIDVRKSIENPRYDATVNILGGITLLESCLAAGVTKMVYASTGGAIYGEPGADHLPAVENTPVKALSGYGVSKYTFEHYMRLFRELHGLQTCTLRYANIYGPRQDPKGEAGVVAIFTDKLLAKEAPTIFGDGEQTRDYVYVGDVCRANLMAAEKLDGGTYNIGTGVETSVLELLKALQDVTDSSDVTAKFEPARPGEVLRIALSAAHAKEHLGWEPQHSLLEGLKATVESHKVKA